MKGHRVSLEIIGYIRANQASETHLNSGPLVDHDYVISLAKAHEESGFDRCLIGYTSLSPDGLQVAAYVGAHTERLGFLIAHRPGFVAPTVAARAFATLDQFTRGRVAIHTISGASDAEQRKDGDWLGKADRYARTEEFMQIMRRAWTEDKPFSYRGRYYQVADYVSPVRPYKSGSIPMFFGGSSADAVRIGAREADLFLYYGMPLADLQSEIDGVRQACADAGRPTPPRFGASFRVILGETDGAAWRRAHEILEVATKNDKAGALVSVAQASGDISEGTRKVIDAARRVGNDSVQKALWMPMTGIGAAGSSAALVGTASTVVDALLPYVDLGITTFLLRGYDPLEDAADYGAELIPMLRNAVSTR